MTYVLRYAGCLLAGALFLFSGALAADEAPAYKIIERHASIQILPVTSSLYCIDTILVHRLTHDRQPLILSLLNIFDVRGAEVASKSAQFKRGNGIIRFDDTPSDSEFTVCTWYNGDILGANDMSQISHDRSVLREEMILPGLEENLRRARITMVVPKGWYALTSGALALNETHGDSSTYVWTIDTPVSNISWFVAGKYKRTEFPGKIPVSLGLFLNDSTTIPGQFGSLADRVLRYYSKTFGEYRFPKLEIVEVDNWVAGHNALAIAAPSFIMVKQAAFATPDTFNQAQTILPHEIAHQWWPLTAYIEQRDAALLAEGMCEYSARLFHESEGRLNPRDSLGNHPLLRPLIMKAQSGTDIPLRQLADLRNVQTHYLRSAYVHHMLRQILGDSLFLSLYRTYCAAFIGTPARQDDFQHIAERLGGKNLQWFFSEWTDRIAIPKIKVYRAQAVKDPTGWKTTGRVRILGYEKFTTFADVGVVAGRDTGYARVWLGQPLPRNLTDTIGVGEYHNDVGFEVHTTSEPGVALLDPQGNSLKISKIPARLSDLRDPGRALMIIGTQKNASHLRKLAETDSIAMEMGGWELSIKTDAEVTLQSLQQEHVFLYGTPSENSIVADNVDKFKNGFRNDSAIVNGAAVYDTSLVLLQAIDNPYFVNGLLCWVAPLSEKAEAQLLPYDYSWILVRGTENISSGNWLVDDEDLHCVVKK